MPQFDYDTITDVVMHLRYTAREGGGVLKQQAMAELQRTLNALAQADGNKGLVRAFRLRHEFASGWHRFLNSPAGSTGHQTLTMALGKDRFPFMFEDENKTRFPIVFPDKAIKIRAMEMFVKVKHDFTATYDESSSRFRSHRVPLHPPPRSPLWLGTGFCAVPKTLAGVPGDWTLTAWLETGGILNATP